MQGRKNTSVPFEPKILQQLMKESNLNQKQLGEKIGYSRETISLAMRKGVIDKYCLELIAEYYNVHPSYLRGLSKRNSKVYIDGTINYAAPEIKEQISSLEKAHIEPTEENIRLFMFLQYRDKLDKNGNINYSFDDYEEERYLRSLLNNGEIKKKIFIDCLDEYTADDMFITQGKKLSDYPYLCNHIYQFFATNLVLYKQRCEEKGMTIEDVEESLKNDKDNLHLKL